MTMLYKRILRAQMSTKCFSFPCFAKIFLKAKAVFHNIFCRVGAHIAVMPRLIGYPRNVLLVFWVPQNKSVLGAVLIHPLERIEFFIVMLKVGIIFPVIG